MRGKLSNSEQYRRRYRITPAHAGKTSPTVIFIPSDADHPRTCGENPFALWIVDRMNGSPPHMRGKLQKHENSHLEHRITPAHAGKTPLMQIMLQGKLDHPRTCGENRPARHILSQHSGSPPHMRGKHDIYADFTEDERITPAHAGKTDETLFKMAALADHPRTCGENT